MRNEVRLQVTNLKAKGTIPGIQSRLRSVSGLDSVVEEQCDWILYANDPERTSLGFTPGEIANIGGPGEQIKYSPGYASDIPPFWLWYSIYITIDPDTFLLTESLARKWCIAIDETSPTCHKGFLTVVTDNEDVIPVTFVDDYSDELFTDDDEAMPLGMDEEYWDEQIPNIANWLITNEETDLTNTADWSAVVATPTVP